MNPRPHFTCIKGDGWGAWSAVKGAGKPGWRGAQNKVPVPWAKLVRGNQLSPALPSPSETTPESFFKIYLFTFGPAGSLLPHRGFLSCSEWGPLFIAVPGLLIAVASLVAEPGPWSTGSVAAAHRLSFPMACAIFPDQGSNPCPWHWQASSFNYWTTREVLS